MGLSQPFMAASGDIEPHALTVLIPKRDYGRLLLKSKLEIGGLLMLLVFFGGACCLFYTRRYFRPILEDIDHVTEIGGDEGQPFFEELLPLSTKLRDHEQTITDLETEKQDLQGQMEQVEANAKRLAQKRKDEIDPEEYHVFLSSYQKLGAESRAVIDAMVDGVQCSGACGTARKKDEHGLLLSSGYLRKGGYSGGEQTPAAPCPRLAHAAGANRIRRFPRPL